MLYLFPSRIFIAIKIRITADDYLYSRPNNSQDGSVRSLLPHLKEARVPDHAGRHHAAEGAETKGATIGHVNLSFSLAVIHHNFLSDEHRDRFYTTNSHAPSSRFWFVRIHVILRGCFWSTQLDGGYGLRGGYLVYKGVENLTSPSKEATPFGNESLFCCWDSFWGLRLL